MAATRQHGCNVLPASRTAQCKSRLRHARRGTSKQQVQGPKKTGKKLVKEKALAGRKKARAGRPLQKLGKTNRSQGRGARRETEKETKRVFFKLACPPLQTRSCFRFPPTAILGCWVCASLCLAGRFILQGAYWCR